MLSTEKRVVALPRHKTTTGLLSRTEIGLKVVVIPAILMGKPA